MQGYLIKGIGCILIAGYMAGCDSGLPDVPDTAPETVETYYVSGTLSGLTGKLLVLQLNEEYTLTLNDNGRFTFDFPLPDFSEYKVVVKSSPVEPSQDCVVKSGTGVVESSNVEHVKVECVSKSYSISGVLSGLQGGVVVLANNGGDILTLPTNGAFAFHEKVFDQSSYEVSVESNPSNPSQLCKLENGSGKVQGENVSNLKVECTTVNYTIGGSVAGLKGNGLVLENNSSESLAIESDGAFEFLNSIADGQGYMVTVAAQPNEPDQVCSVAQGSGILSGEGVTNVTVTCATQSYQIGGAISGLAGSGLEIGLNGTHQLTITENGDFSFGQPVADASAYSVSILQQPSEPSQTCSVISGEGVITGANIQNISIECETNAYTVSGTLSGLEGRGLVLQNNLSDDLAVESNGSFTFSTEVMDQDDYSVTVKVKPSQPVQNCTVQNGQGTIAASNKDDVLINCVSEKFAVGGVLSGLASGSITLSLNGAESLVLSGDGAFKFNTPLLDLSDYQVSVSSQTNPSQVCKLNQSSGTLNGANVDSVKVSCEAGYIVGGTISGLEQGNLIRLTNGTDTLLVSGNGSFEFSMPLASGDEYGVVIDQPPSQPEQQCTLLHASGTVGNSDVNVVSIKCWPSATALSLDYQPIKIFKFSWPSNPNVTYYKLLKDPDGQLGYSEVVEIEGTEAGYSYEAALPLDIHARFILEACNDHGCQDSEPVYVQGNLATAIGYIKPSVVGNSDQFGYSVAVSGDGNVVAVGAPYEDSSVESMDPLDNSVQDSGAVYVFRKVDGIWQQEAFLKASNAERDDSFGYAVALNNDGSVLIAGAPLEDSSAEGVNGDQGSNESNDSGAAYLYEYIAGSWQQEAYLKKPYDHFNTERFGYSLDIDSDGRNVIVGSHVQWGYIFRFAKNSDGWEYVSYLNAPSSYQEGFGNSLSLSSDGASSVYGLYRDHSSSSGFGGDPTDETLGSSGAVYISSSTTNRGVYTKAFNPSVNDNFGWSTAISGDGRRVAVGSPREASSLGGIGQEVDDGASNSGAVYTYVKGSGGSWEFDTMFKAFNNKTHLAFGSAVVLDEQGSLLLVGAKHEDSLSVGLNEEGADTDGKDSGAGYIYERKDGTWTLLGYIKSPNTEYGDNFGHSIDMSLDAQVIAIGAPLEDGGAAGIGGDQSSNSFQDSGAVYLY